MSHARQNVPKASNREPRHNEIKAVVDRFVLSNCGARLRLVLRVAMVLWTILVVF
jgi:hypothetical protein